MKVEVKNFFILKWQNKISSVLKTFWAETGTLTHCVNIRFSLNSLNPRCRWLFIENHVALNFFQSTIQYCYSIDSQVCGQKYGHYLIRESFLGTNVVIYNMIWPSSHYVSSSERRQTYMSVFHALIWFVSLPLDFYSACRADADWHYWNHSAYYVAPMLQSLHMKIRSHIWKAS